VDNLTSNDRAVAIAGTAGKVINLLNARVPKADAQILLKVKFADVDRSASAQFGVNFFSTGLGNTPGAITTGQFSPPQVQTTGKATTVSVQNALNVFLLRPDLNFGATIEALQAKNLAQILAEPNVLAINGKPASFLAGGEFPYPTLQGGGGGLGAVTIAFREFGVRINFLPQITPRNTIRLQVTPEVSSLDFANGLVFQGFTIPALSTRRVQTELEMESGQTFVIGGLLDNRLQDTVNKIPGLANIPLVGKLFTSKQLTKSNTELLVMVTAELVRPMPADLPRPEVKMPQQFLKEGAKQLPRQPGMDVTGPVPAKPPTETIPVEELQQFQKTAPATPAGQQTPQLQFVPVLTPPSVPQTQPYALPAPPAAPSK
jgi:pilus assembly protein CpaC